MRIISYNILDGGEGRADPLAEIIEAQRPDVVALVEADNLDVVERIAKRLDMDFVHAPGKKHASVLASRWPIVESINHAAISPALAGSFLEATVRDPAGFEWPVGVVHLHAHATEADERLREGEIAEILRLMEAHRAAGRTHLLAGDFNANLPTQQIDPAACKQRTQEEWKQNGGQLPRRAVQMVLDAGYVDSLAALDPARAATAGTFSTQHPGQRVDYIFAFGVAAREGERPREPQLGEGDAPAEPRLGGSLALPRGQVRLCRAWIEQDRLAKYASDHYPIGLEITP